MTTAPEHPPALCDKPEKEFPGKVTPPQVDYAHTKKASKNRSVKASMLVDAAVALGFTVHELQPVTDPGHTTRRGMVRRAAGLQRASEETWAAALVDLLERTSRSADRDCAQCKAPVRRVMTEGGKWMDVDPLPHPDGNVMRVEQTTPGSNVPRVRVLTGSAHKPEDVQLFRDHMKSCPNGSRALMAKKRATRKCRECGQPMDPHLVELQPQYDTHPSCDRSDFDTAPRKETR